jgi:hypothetical protein
LSPPSPCPTGGHLSEGPAWTPGEPVGLRLGRFPASGSSGASPSEARDLEQSDEGDAQDQHESDDHGDGGFELKVVHGDALPSSEGETPTVDIPCLLRWAPHSACVQGVTCVLAERSRSGDPQILAVPVHGGGAPPGDPGGRTPKDRSGHGHLGRFFAFGTGQVARGFGSRKASTKIARAGALERGALPILRPAEPLRCRQRQRSEDLPPRRRGSASSSR